MLTHDDWRDALTELWYAEPHTCDSCGPQHWHELDGTLIPTAALVLALAAMQRA